MSASPRYRLSTVLKQLAEAPAVMRRKLEMRFKTPVHVKVLAIGLGTLIVIVALPVMLLALPLALIAWPFHAWADRRKLKAREESIPKCPRCEQRLRTPLAQQCFNCGLDWHHRPLPTRAEALAMPGRTSDR